MGVRALYGASLSPDATAFAHLVDDGGYPHAVQRFLHGRQFSAPRNVELPVEGPVSRVVHSADGHWLACEVAPEGGTRHQIWVVTTDPEDRMAWRADREEDGTAELIGWDGTRIAAILTGEDGVGQSCLIDPADGGCTVLDRRSGARLVDAWAGAALIRVGPRGYQEMVMLHGDTEIALLPSDPGAVTASGAILDDHHPRRLRYGPTGELARLYKPGVGADGYFRALLISDNGCEHARLLEVIATLDGVSYFVVAERPGCDLDEFAVSADMSTVALLWNLQGRSELQILDHTDYTLQEPIPLPGDVAGELSLSAGGSMVAMTVQGPALPRTVELVDPRTREWQLVDHEPSRGPLARGFSARPTLESITARDGLNLPSWLYRSAVTGSGSGALVYLHGGPEGQARPDYSEIFPDLLNAGISVLTPNVRGSGGLGRTFVHADNKEKRFAAIDDVADCVRFLVDNEVADPGRIGCAGWSYGGYLTMAAMTFYPELFAAGVAICGMSDLTTFYRNTEPWIADAAYPEYGHPVYDRELLERLSPLRRVDALTAPLLVVHGAHDTNVPVGESEQIVAALREAGREVRYLLFADDGHEIVKRENHEALAAAMTEWLTEAFAPPT
ncbi:peptidase S9 [Mycobacterium sp. 852002-50816_SCH5313054-b]|uniref:S9 family peptidase n=1 Tax=Mycobacterium sp. 852002-50816_SCH5313054-b TaxID=1834092 RepID=UPI0007FFD4AD|nr:alpha/beta fold hydrolase [Mycobacterium sp. 852002-50816_SCH5313054-b]OBF60261.1 peptidase S9 [Mycobacterium sp. 852002-50816_SCH5313054-b]